MESCRRRLALAVACVAFIGGRITPVAAELERVQCRNPGLVTDLGVGLYAFPLPMDFLRNPRSTR